MPSRRITILILLILLIVVLCPASSRAQAALLMEEPYGFFGALNPTGHNAIYFERICAETPIQLRRCAPGETGAVIARYQGISGYDWVAIPLLPYLYSVENASEVPVRVNRDMVTRMRDRYHESHLLSLGEDQPAGNFFSDGWTDLVGTAYMRRIYAFSFVTTAAQDDAFIAKMNSSSNRSRYNLLYNNCADFARVVLNFYFPRSFRRSLFPDAGMTTPKQLAWKLDRYARKHPETQLTIFEIPQVPGYRRTSHSNKNVAESLVTTGYDVPIALANPYLAGGVLVDYLVRGRFHIIPRHPQVLAPDNLSKLTPKALTASALIPQNPESAGNQAPGAVKVIPAQSLEFDTAETGPTEMKATHE